MRHTILRSIPLLVALALAGAPAAHAGDLTVFAAQASPTDLWQPGFGATLSTSILDVAALEAEAARTSAEADGDMTSFSVSAMLAPALGPLVPFAGVGVGLYRQNLGDAHTTDVVRSFAAGLKVNIGRVFVIRGEYRHFTLSGPVRIQMDNRLSVGAGIQF